MKKIGVVGANGFVGRAICRAFKNYDYEISEITRENCDEYKTLKYDVLINTAMPSKRFWALNNPMKDVEATILKTAELLYEWQYEKFIQISSLSAKMQLDAPYGIHKRSSEVLVENRENFLIIRLGALYGDGLDKSALFDMVNHNHIYVDINSEYNYIDIDFVADWITRNLDKTGLKEIGARDTISLIEISKKVWKNPSYEGRIERIYSDELEAGMPSSKEVLKYVEKIKECRGDI
jgi:nucleoside-diphosphate-sugar epimerase